VVEDNQINKLTTKVAILDKEFEQVRNSYSKLDVAVEKLSEVADDIRTLVTVQQSKLDYQEQETNYVKSSLKEFKVFVNDELKVGRTYIIEELQSFKDSLEKVDNRISKLEKWKWVAIGGATVIGYAIAQMPSIMLG